MRKILFRAKRKDNGEWVYGNLLQYIDWTSIGAGDSTFHISNKETREIVEVYADTIGQFTGLCDKNGKEIFEGDLIQHEKYIWEVWLFEECGAFGAVGFTHTEHILFANGKFIPKANNGFVDECEIVGNVYANA